MAKWKETGEGNENQENRQETSESKENRSHFESAYELTRNDNYEANGYKYKTDDRGRITRCEGTLELQNNKANQAHQRKAGGEDRLEEDDGGHLIARRFNGSEKIDNIVAMDKHLNRGEYKKMENEWDKALKDGKTVETDIRLKYKGDSQRPDKIFVASKITDQEGNTEWKIYSFRNEEEQYAPHSGGRKWEKKDE